MSAVGAATGGAAGPTGAVGLAAGRRLVAAANCAVEIASSVERAHTRSRRPFSSRPLPGHGWARSHAPASLARRRSGSMP
jgi:hypothetical protein